MAWLEAEADEVPSASLYLHGALGRGRTATVAVALLMHQEVPLRRALAMLDAAAGECSLSPTQRAFLDHLASRLDCEGTGDLSAAGDG
jgi:protein-tyrosine phosphatase